MWSAAILAGGRAARLDGQAKHLLPVGGRAILARQLEMLAALGAGDVAIVGRPDIEVTTGVRLVSDVVDNAGALGGLYTALTTARSDRVLVIACDLPFLSSAFVAHLLATGLDADAVVPRTVDGWHPLCGVYHCRIARCFRARIDRGALRITDALGDIDVHAIDPEEVARFDPDGRLLLNVNTPDDYRRARLEAAARPVDRTRS